MARKLTRFFKAFILTIGIFGLANSTVFATTPQIGTNDGTSYAIRSDGTLIAWGANDYGQFGNNSASGGSSTPVISLTNANKVVGGYHSTAALKSDGSVWVTSPVSSGFSQVFALSSVSTITSAGTNFLVVRSDGSVWGWGENRYGQLGNGNINQYTSDQNTVVQIQSLNGVVALAGGSSHVLALKADGSVMAWGDNNAGQLGDGTTTFHFTPALVSGLSGVSTIAAGTGYSLALKSDGSVWAWGNNSSGQLGDGTFTNSNVPKQVSVLNGIVAIAAGYGSSLAVKSDGSVWVWGANSPSPAQISGASGVKTASIGNGFFIALKVDGTVLAWGDNSYGQLGDGTKSYRLSPSQVVDIDGTITLNLNSSSPPVQASSQLTPAFTATTRQGVLPYTVDLDATTSKVTGGSIVTYKWDVSDGRATSYGSLLSLQFLNSGSYDITLTVTDNNGNTATKKQTVNFAANVAPTASFSASS